MKKLRNKQLIRIALITLVAFLMIVTDVFFVGVIKIHPRSGDDLSQYVDNVNTVEETDLALRGTIYDRNGNVIATDNRTYNIICYLSTSRKLGDKPAYVVDKEDTARKLSEILNINPDTILKYLNQEKAYQTELGEGGRNLSKNVKDEIDALKLPGIGFTKSIQRTYPNGVFASNLIGYETIDKDDRSKRTAYMGFEQYLDSYLSGKNGMRRYQTDANGYTLPGMFEENISAVNGNNVYLTLDAGIQLTLEESFRQTNELFHTYRAWGGVMEVNTGKVIAWGQTPSFDPNTLENITDYNNIGATVPYEPGSTLKTITWAAAINEGKYDGNAQANGNEYCYGADSHNNPIRAYGDNAIGCIYNAHHMKYGTTTLDEGLVYSMNTVAGTIQNEWINADTHLEYVKKFGFFTPVNTDGLPEETGYLNFTWPADKLALSYGQGSSVTMLQLFRAYSAVFGDGTMVKPYFVESIRDSYDSSSVKYQAQTEEVGHPITEESARKLQGILAKVVASEGGSARHYRIDECDIIGKTGTTEVAGTGAENAYDTGRTITSVMLAMPADNPQVLVYYAFDADQDSESHRKSGPITSLLRKVAQTYGFTKGTNEPIGERSTVISEEVSTDMPNLINHTLEYANAKLENSQTNIIILGNGNTVIQQYPRTDESVYSGENVYLLTDSESFTMPDLTGWTRKDVTALWAVTGFEFILDGYGTVSAQSVPAGTVVNKGTPIQVEFS